MLDEGEASSSEEVTHSAEPTLEDSGLEVLLWKGKYLMVPTEEGIAVVHIRRAHMRIQYERYLKSKQDAASQVMPSQRLLIPEAITLSKPEVLALIDARETLAAMGMELSQVDEQTVELTAVPSDLTSHVREALDAVLETFHDGHWDDSEARHRRWAQAWAERVAPKGEVAMPLDARRRLVADLWACEQPHSDPMGRPVMSVWASKTLKIRFADVAEHPTSGQEFDHPECDHVCGVRIDGRRRCASVGRDVPWLPFFQPWQVVTHMFMHGDLGHIFFNMFALFMFGSQLERVWGPQRFLTYYVVCGLGAFALHELVVGLQFYADYGTFFPAVEQFVSPNASPLQKARVMEIVYGRVVGASGAVFGLLLAFGMLFPNTQLMLLFPPIPIRAKYFVMGYGAIELLLALQNSPGDNVAHFAHLGGMIFGYVLLKRWQQDRGHFY